MTKSTLRLFVAAPLSPALLEKLITIAEPYRPFPVRLTPPENLHLTLFFLGNTHSDRLPELVNTLSRIAAEQTPFSLQPEGVFPGPGKSNPRLVWARFARNIEFENLSATLLRQLAPNEQAPKEYIPHITLARLHKHQKLATPLPVFPAGELEELKVNSMGLWQSVLGQPQPRYSVLHLFPFGKL